MKLTEPCSAGFGVQDFLEAAHGWRPSPRPEKFLLIDVLHVSTILGIPFGVRYAVRHLGKAHLGLVQKLNLSLRYSVFEWFKAMFTALVNLRRSAWTDEDRASIDDDVDKDIASCRDEIVFHRLRLVSGTPKADPSETRAVCRHASKCLKAWVKIWRTKHAKYLVDVHMKDSRKIMKRIRQYHHDAGRDWGCTCTDSHLEAAARALDEDNKTVRAYVMRYVANYFPHISDTLAREETDEDEEEEEQEEREVVIFEEDGEAWGLNGQNDEEASDIDNSGTPLNVTVME